MCIMFVKTKDQHLEPKLIERMYDMGNRDGFGMMWVETINGVDRVKVEKSMMSWKGIMDLYEKEMHRNMAVHLRNANYGEKNLENCHPYPILDIDKGDKMDLWMMHNGTIRDVQVDKKMSDSWNFATKFLPGYFRKHPNALQDKDFQYLLTAIIGPNKLVFLDSKNRFTIVNEDLGAYHPTGVWISTKQEVKVLYYNTTPVHNTPPKDTISGANGGTGFGKRNETNLPQVGNWHYKVGGWDQDSDGRIHYNPNLKVPDADVIEADGITAEPPDTDTTDNGILNVDEEGVYETLKSIPTQKRGDVYNFIIEYQKEARWIFQTLGKKDEKEARLLVLADPWAAVDPLKALAAAYVNDLPKAGHDNVSTDPN
jgi:predicted glutamine amidotransferase